MPIPQPFTGPDPLQRRSPNCPSPSTRKDSCPDSGDASRLPPLATHNHQLDGFYGVHEYTDDASGRVSPGETRQQLIQRVKREQREQRPSWLADAVDLDHVGSVGAHGQDHDQGQGQRRAELFPSPSSLLEQWPLPQSPASAEPCAPASSLERPRSALHRGDFHRHTPSDTPRPLDRAFDPSTSSQTENQWLGSSPPAPWLNRLAAAAPPLTAPHFGFGSSADEPRPAPIPFQARPRAISHSLASSFVFRPPTSPLANQSNSTDLDTLDEAYELRTSQSPDRSSRRRTFSPSALRNLERDSIGYGHSRIPSRPLPNSRRQGSSPYQAHQPRRSVTSFSETSSFGAWNTPSAHSRRPSLASETSPLQQLPMVGRYEESILRGRMSSLPSKPVEFLAQIGVLGKGNCKASLKCPPHVSVPFPAVFYNYGSKPGLSSMEGPSPYVGRIELEKHLKAKRKNKPKRSDRRMVADRGLSEPMEIDMPATSKRQCRREANKATPDGTYRIPEKGQIQVIVKNPNKTAVKLFLIPYDLAGMAPGQKTWIRQRSYTSGPILDKALTCNPEGVSRPVDAGHRPVLRYLIHLHICCLSKGRFYLYKEIRIVFANRVPDGKEKLRQEITLPEPRFSVHRDRDGVKETKDAQGETRKEASGTRDGLSRLVTPPGSEISTGGRPNFAWESFAPTDTGPQLFKSMPSMAPLDNYTGLVAHASGTATRDEDVQMTDDSPPSPSDHAMRQRDGSTPSSSTKSPTLHPALFERLHRDQWSPNGAPPRVKSPAPGEGLISRQHRTWAERYSSSEPENS